ncbi:MAG: substrate-binding domain-containing protein [Clostridia bacterium]
MVAAGVASAADIEFWCTDALVSSMRELVPPFERASGHHVKVTAANAGTIAARLGNGEAPDLAIVLPPAWERLRHEGRIDAGARTIVGKVGLGAFVRRGARKPDLGTTQAFKEAILNARAIAVRDPSQRSPVGTYMLKVFERLELADAIKGRLVLTAHPPYEEVIRGDADIGFSTLAEIAAEPRVELAGPLPTEIQTYNVFTTAIPLGRPRSAATGEFLHFLASESAKATLRSKGIGVD